MKNLLTGLVLSAGMVCSGAVWAAPCLQTGQIDDWKALPGNRGLIVTDTGQNKFKVTLEGICPDLQWHSRLGFAPFGRSRLSCLARGDKILTRNVEGLQGQTCPVTKVEAYTPEMEKADAAVRRR